MSARPYTHLLHNWWSSMWNIVEFKQKDTRLFVNLIVSHEEPAEKRQCAC